MHAGEQLKWQLEQQQQGQRQAVGSIVGATGCKNCHGRVEGVGTMVEHSNSKFLHDRLCTVLMEATHHGIRVPPSH